ncbi:MAG: NUDIX hydrolase [Proteobacteria bacterium]|nr:NUDIX hydrolase [Pseudomonadota bacterium]
MTDSPRRLYAGRVVTLDVVDVTLPNGHVATLEVVGHPGGAAVVAVDAAGRVCLLRQYRHVAGGWLWEIPAGKLDGKSPDATARAELAEEAGVSARDWQPLGEILSSPGVFREVVHLYLARELSPVELAHEAAEVIEVTWVPFADALRRALDGEIRDAKTVVALVRAAGRLGLPAARER